MSDFDEWVATRQELRRDPGIKNWEIELERLFLGQRKNFLEPFESASEYVESLISTSSDPAIARVAFREALGNIVQGWQPSPEPSSRSSSMLDLISTYTPPAGLPKVLDLVNQFGDFGLHGEWSDRSELTLLALRALQSFFPVSRNDTKAPLFLTYKGILLTALKDKRYSKYALPRLIALAVFNISDRRITTLFAEDSGLIEGLVSYWLGTANTFDAEINLLKIYEHCLILDSGARAAFVIRFIDSLNENGANFNLDYNLNPTIEHLGRVLRLDLSLLTRSALEAFKERHLIAALLNPASAGRAVIKLLLLGLTEPASLEVRDAIAVNPSAVLLELLTLARSTLDQALRSKLLSAGFDHCLALDEEKDTIDTLNIFKSLWQGEGFELCFFPALGEEVEIQMEVDGTDIPLVIGPERAGIAWKAVERVAFENSVLFGA